MIHTFKTKARLQTPILGIIKNKWVHFLLYRKKVVSYHDSAISAIMTEKTTHSNFSLIGNETCLFESHYLIYDRLSH
jgi:hypothetical protein